MKSIPSLTYLSVLLLLIIFQCTTKTYPSNYYVDKNASGRNNGTSWANAWQSFSDINWNLIHPGDVIYISGGTDSTIYYETLTATMQRDINKRITIIAGKYAPSSLGHRGRVIIDGQSETRHESIFFDDYSGTAPAYVTVKGFECRQGTAGVNFNIDSAPGVCTGNILDSLNIYDWYDLAGVLCLGNADSTIIQNCRIVTFLNKG